MQNSEVRDGKGKAGFGPAFFYAPFGLLVDAKNGKVGVENEVFGMAMLEEAIQQFVFFRYRDDEVYGMGFGEFLDTEFDVRVVDEMVTRFEVFDHRVQEKRFLRCTGGEVLVLVVNIQNMEFGSEGVTELVYGFDRRRVHHFVEIAGEADAADGLKTSIWWDDQDRDA